MKIFLLEDNEIFTREFIKLVLKHWHSIDVCRTLEKYSFQKADIYLIDLQIWSEFSFDIIKDIRSKTNAPIAMMTHHDNIKYLNKWAEFWANYYIDKYEINKYWFHLKILENNAKIWL